MAQSQEPIITTNWKRTQPSSHFGTRNLQWYYFSMDYNLYADSEVFGNPDNFFMVGDLPAAYSNGNSLYSALVKTIQEVAGSELYYLGAPTYQVADSFVVAVADDDGAGDLGYKYQIGEQMDAALHRFFGGFTSWTLRPMIDEGYGIFYPNSPSDRRLKRNIDLLETRNDIKIYSFQYLWSDEYFVGVMAQDLLGTKYESAVKEHNGFYTVDYSQLGFNMQLLSEYTALTV
jgi:hypothetical protein